MGEGYNFDNCANLIIPSLSWAMDVNEQFIHRIWRLTSTRPVTIYTLVIANSIDERLNESFSEKSTSAQHAIDHQLYDDPKYPPRPRASIHWLRGGLRASVRA
jgi:SNF2 family DNA or RNA helicase